MLAGTRVLHRVDVNESAGFFARLFYGFLDSVDAAVGKHQFPKLHSLALDELVVFTQRVAEEVGCDVPLVTT